MNPCATSIMFARIALAGAALWLGALTVAPALAGPMQDEQLYTLPQRSEVIHERIGELLTAALTQPETETKLSALYDIARLKLEPLADQAARMLDDRDPVVVTTAIQALGAIDAQAFADRLMRFIAVEGEADRDATEQALIADAMLSRWGVAEAAAVWRARVGRAEAGATLRASAARALGAMPHDDRGATWAALEPVMLDAAVRYDVRLDAARALAALGLDRAAPAEAFADATLERVLEASHFSAAYAQANPARLVALARRADPAAQRIVMTTLLAADAAQLWPIADVAMASADPQVKRLMVRAMQRWHEREPIGLLAAALNDAHPDVRNEARRVLRALAEQPALDEPIRAALRAELGRAVAERKAASPKRWRAAEQAALLLGALDDEASAAALVQLTERGAEHGRLEVRLASIAALREIDVASTRPHLLELMTRLIERLDRGLKRYRKETNAAAGGPVTVPGNAADSQLGEEVAQTLGVWRVAEADAILRRLIPKDAFGAHPDCRAAAIWALGLLHEEQPDDKLAQALIDRVYDQNPNYPEHEEVRLHSVIAIGRMKATSQLKGVKLRYEVDALEIQCAARWAVIRMTGEDPGAIVLEPSVNTDAFIQPTR